MSTTLDLSDLAIDANAELEGASALEIMGWAYERFGAGLVVTSSMLLRNAVNLLGLLAVFALVALPLVKLAVLVFVYRLVAAAISVAVMAGSCRGTARPCFR